MILTRTPFRFTIGGGGTDLPSYYQRYGGFVVSAAINQYMYVLVNRPKIDDWIRVKYSKSETVHSLSELQHELARTALKEVGITKRIEVISMADIPAGTGLGSSSCYTVGILNALYALTRRPHSQAEIAEKACEIEMIQLHKPSGKQDPYAAALGGLPIMEISKTGKVTTRPLKLKFADISELNRNTLLFYTGTTRLADEILGEQTQSIQKEDKKVIESMHRIAEIGHKIVESLEMGNLDDFGALMDEHWSYKRRISTKMSNPTHEAIYQTALENGALGGKVTGAGGGGFFVFYTSQAHKKLRRAMLEMGLRELHYQFDLEGTKILMNQTELGYEEE